MSLDYYQHLHQPGAGPDAPSLVLLHGTGGDARSFLELGERLAPGAAKLSLQGDVDEFGHARFFRRQAEGVYDMADLSHRTARLAAFLDAARDAYGLAPERMVGVGFSNGANILANLVFEHPTALRRAALMHPLIPFEPPKTALSDVQALITAGRRDPICPPEQTEALAAALRRRGAAVELVWRPGGHQVDAAELEAIEAFARGAGDQPTAGAA